MDRDKLMYELWVLLGVWDRPCCYATIHKPRLLHDRIDKAIMLSAIGDMGVN